MVDDGAVEAVGAVVDVVEDDGAVVEEVEEVDAAEGTMGVVGRVAAGAEEAEEVAVAGPDTDEEVDVVVVVVVAEEEEEEEEEGGAGGFVGVFGGRGRGSWDEFGFPWRWAGKRGNSSLSSWMVSLEMGSGMMSSRNSSSSRSLTADAMSW